MPALAGPLTTGIENFARTQAANLIASSQFERVWAEVNRIAHTTQVVTLLEGNEGGAITAQDDQITLNLAPVIGEVSSRLTLIAFLGQPPTPAQAVPPKVTSAG